jgi:hypothetical protein
VPCLSVFITCLVSQFSALAWSLRIQKLPCLLLFSTCFVSLFSIQVLSLSVQHVPIFLPFFSTRALYHSIKHVLRLSVFITCHCFQYESHVSVFRTRLFSLTIQHVQSPTVLSTCLVSHVPFLLINTSIVSPVQSTCLVSQFSVRALSFSTQHMHRLSVFSMSFSVQHMPCLTVCHCLLLFSTCFVFQYSSLSWSLSIQHGPCLSVLSACIIS